MSQRKKPARGLRRLSLLGIAFFVLIVGALALFVFNGVVILGREQTVGQFTTLGLGNISPQPGETNTPPIPTPGMSWPLDKVPPGIEIATSMFYEPEIPDPIQLTPWVSPTPATPLPTLTPLPTTSADDRSPYAAQNLILIPGPPPVDEELRSPSSGPVTYGFASWSPDGSLFAVTRGVGDAKFYPDALGGGTKWRPDEIVLFNTNGQSLGVLAAGREPVWSPTGEYLALQYWDMEHRAGSIQIVEVNTHQTTEVTMFTERHVHPSMTWISSSELLFYLGIHDLYRTESDKEGMLWIFDLKSGELRPLLTGNVAAEVAQNAPDALLYRLSAHPGKGLIAVNSDKWLFIFQREDVDLKIMHKLASVVTGHAVFSPDGDAIAYVTASGPIIVSLIDPDRGSVELAFGDTAWPLIWSPQGSSLAFRSWDGWYIVNRDGSGLRLLDELPKLTRSLWWTDQAIWVAHGEEGQLSRFISHVR